MHHKIIYYIVNTSLCTHGYTSGWIPNQTVEKPAQAVAVRNQNEVQNGVVDSRMKGQLRDQVTESSCGCFLAQAVVSQWLCDGALGGCSARAAQRANAMQTQGSCEVYV
jgi:hypothetical protein